jgi:predicted RNA methylase
MMILQGECIEVIKTLPDNSVDAVITDPPYGLSFMGKKWDYDVPSVEIWQECLRVLKHGGYVLSFAGTRTQHRMACNIEDAGFEIRDMIAWVYGSGFPKSRNIGKDVEKTNVGGLKNLKQIGIKKGIKCETGTKGYSYSKEYVAGVCMGGKQISGDIPVYEINNEWEGWGTALKPALEPITVARKPLEKGLTVAENCLKWGVGGINIDGCRVESNEELGRNNNARTSGTSYVVQKETMRIDNSGGKRFPANLIHDGSQEVLDLFPNSKSTVRISEDKDKKQNTFSLGRTGTTPRGHNDSGSAARFFYCAKASKAERNRGCEGLEEKFKSGTEFRPSYLERYEETGDNGTPSARFGKMTNNHPTVKPIALMEYLVKLVTREGQTVLDPFAGSGTTGIACKNLNREAILIEREAEYVEIAKCRMAVNQ